MKKTIPKKGYRTLAIMWTLAAAAMAVAFVRYLPLGFNLLLLLLLALSVLVAANFWKCYKRTPEQTCPDPFAAPPKFADNPILFDDDPNQNSEEKNHE